MTGLARWRCPAYPISPFLRGGDLVAYPLNGADRESNCGAFFRVPAAYILKILATARSNGLAGRKFRISAVVDRGGDLD
jgi:hypothetical protein